MPKVQTYGQPQVGPVETTGARFRPADNDGGALGGVARGAKALGGALSDFANTQDQIEDDLAQTSANDLLLQYQSSTRTATNGLKEKRGKDALLARPGASAAIGTAYDDILGKADARTRRYLEPRLKQYRALADDDVAGYARDQMRVYDDEVGAARQVNAAEQATANWDKPDLRLQFIEDGKTQLRTNLARRGMSDPEIIANEERKYVSGIHAGIVDNFLVSGDVDGAQVYLEANADDIDLGDELRLRNALKGPLEQRQAAADFDAVTTGAIGAPGTGMSDFGAILSNEGGVDPKTGAFRVSPKGAVGPAQVMPATAPEAAKLAGLKWDEKKYRSDPAYNTKLGEAYYKEMLRQFKDPEVAAAAYNAGPDRVRKALEKGGNWRDNLPAETRKYINDFTTKTGPQQGARRWNADDVYARIDARADAEGWTFERRERAKDYATGRISRDEQLLARQESAANEQALEFMQSRGVGYTDPSQIPRAVWGKMSVEARERAIDTARQNVRGVQVPANSDAAIGLHAIQYGDPDRFRDMDLSPYQGKITQAELDSAISEQAKMRGPAGQQMKSARDNINSAINFNTLGDKALAKALDKKNNPEAYAAVARDMEAYLQSVTGGKREPTDAETDAAFKRATMKVIVPGSGWFGSDREMPRYAVPDGARTQVRVPTEVRQRIVASWKRNHNGADPPDGVVGDIYMQHKGKAGFW